MTFPEAAKKYADSFMLAGADASQQLANLLFSAAAIDCGTYLVSNAVSLFKEQDTRANTSAEINWASKARRFLEDMFDACGPNADTLKVLVLISDLYEVDNELCTYKRSCRKDITKTPAERERAVRFSTFLKDVYVPELGKALLVLPAVAAQRTILVLRGFHRTIPEEQRARWNKNRGYGVLTGRCIWLKDSEFESVDLWDDQACLTAVEGDIACLSFAALLCKLNPYLALASAAGLNEEQLKQFGLSQDALRAMAVSMDGDVIANSVIQHHVAPELSNFFVMRPRPRHVVKRNGGPSHSHFYRVDDLVHTLKTLGYEDPLVFVLLMSVAGNDFVYHIRELSPLKAEAALKRLASKTITMRDYGLFGTPGFSLHKNAVVNRFGPLPLIIRDPSHNTLKVNYPRMYELVLQLIKTVESTPAIVGCRCEDELLDTCKQVYGNMPRSKKQKLSSGDGSSSSSSSVTLSTDDPDFAIEAEEEEAACNLEYSKSHITHHELYLAATSASHYMTYILKELSLTARHTHKVLTTEPGFVGPEQTYFRSPDDPKKILMGTLRVLPAHLGLEYPK